MTIRQPATDTSDGMLLMVMRSRKRSMLATYSIAAYFRWMWTTGLNSAENVSAKAQIIDNDNQDFDRAADAMGAQSKAAFLLHVSSVRGQVSPGVIANNAHQVLRLATHLIANYVLSTWAAGRNGAENTAADHDFWRNVA
jgi:hypothetical protein